MYKLLVILLIILIIDLFYKKHLPQVKVALSSFYRTMTEQKSTLSFAQYTSRTKKAIFTNLTILKKIFLKRNSKF